MHGRGMERAGCRTFDLKEDATEEGFTTVFFFLYQEFLHYDVQRH